MIDLTEQQWQAIKTGEAIRVSAPEIGEDVILLRAPDYDSLLDLVADQREQRCVLRYSMKQAARVAKSS